MIIVSDKVELSQLVDVFGNQLEDYQLEAFALQLVQEDIGRAVRLLQHLDYYIKTA